jgi:type IV pilus assembly protein PilY1
MNWVKHTLAHTFFLVTMAGWASMSSAADVAQTPLFLTQSAEPVVMLNMSNDHQLFFKAYDDYTDLDEDGVIDTTYDHDFRYFGYFDPFKCYDYDTSDNRFEPTSNSATRYCSGEWSGNFLNWASMTRMDAVRRILYGGKRVVDSETQTVLERAYLPTDAHSFAKFYNGTDLDQLTPFSSGSGVTFCNTTVQNSGLSQDATAPPLLRVAEGNHSLWAANERWQCRWSEEKSASNDNDSASSGLAASDSNPGRVADGLGQNDYVVRVEACVTGLLGTEDCKQYPDGSFKPAGLLQEYGDSGAIRFGLMTGSYGSNKSGGVLRKNATDMSDEINVDTYGTFTNTDGIIRTLDNLRIYGYRYDNGTYFGATGSDNCQWGLNTFDDGDCSNWGNPQAEIFLESLRYLAGESENAAFASSDSSYIDELDKATWEDPVPEAKWCAALNVIQFNASTISFDGDGLASFGDITSDSLATITDTIGAGENLHGNEYFVGESGADNNQLCTGKTVNSLAGVRGTCPDAPRLSGSYHLAGLAHFARTNSIRSDRNGEQKVTTYGVALSPAMPRVEIPVPGDTRMVTILPACRNRSIGGNCAIVDFKIVDQDIAAGTGKFYVNWEDSEQGGDFDQDMWGIVEYDISGSNITVTTDVIAQSTPNEMGFGYILSGTNRDGFHVHSGINNFDYNDPTGVTDCNNCQTADGPSSVTYSIGTSSAALLESPLYYAAKWGGFRDEDGDDTPNLAEEWDADGNGRPDTYFFAIDPNKLKDSLSEAFAGVVKTSSSAASVATNSTRLDVDTVVYQARFNSEDWRGQLLAFQIESDGSVGDALWDAGDIMPADHLRDIYTLNPASGNGVTFTWANLAAAQQAALNTLPDGTVDSLGSQRLDWLRGDDAQEQRNGGAFRNRTITILGDIINSDPYFVGKPDYRYHQLPDATEASEYVAFRNSAAYQARRDMLYVGSNDGMLHAFDANTGVEQFAYVPNLVFEKLSALTEIDYAHQYYVDGSARAADAYINSAWRTVLLGNLGGGGGGIFALDVTNPDTFNTTSVMWEFTDADMGDYGTQATVIRLNNGDWAALVGNGFESTAGRAYLYLIGLDDGSIIRKIPAGTETSNGLATPVPVDTDGDRITDSVYAGDLQGNMWKFDLNGSNAAQWGVEFKQGANDRPLFTASDAGGTRQPITQRPAVGRHPDGGYMVYFGTGSFHAVGDNVVTSPAPEQTFYGIRDNGSRLTNGRNQLQEQEIVAEVAAAAGDVRVVSDNAVNYGSDAGWYLDLVSPVNGAEGERSVANPVLRGDRIIFTTLIPSSEPCDFGGSGWLMELDALNGMRLPYSVLDIDGDGQFDADDFVEVDGTMVPVSGLRSSVGIIKSPGIISAGDREFKYASGSTGEIAVITERNSTDGGRKSWREIK